MVSITETQAPSPRLELLGFETCNFLLNGGSLFIFFSVWFLVLAISFLLSALGRKCQNWPRLSRFANWLERQLKWNSFFNLVFASQIELLLSAIIQLKHWNFAQSGDKVACIFTILTCLLFTIAPIV